MRAGRYAKACEAALDGGDNAVHFTTWMMENVRARATLVPQAEVEAKLGGPLAEYGVKVGLYDVEGTVPGGSVEVPSVPGEVDPTELLGMLPPLAVEAEPLVPPGPVNVAEFTPQPVPGPAEERPRRSGLFGDVVGALVGAAFDVGRVVGGVIMFPAALSVGLMVGTVEVITNVGALALGTTSTGEILGKLAGPGATGSSTTSTTSSSPGKPAYQVPIYLLRPTKVTGTLDALLDEREHATLAEARRLAWEEQRAAVAAEHARRVSLAEGVRALLGVCSSGTCRRVQRPGSQAVTVWPVFRQGEVVCPAHGVVTVVALAGDKEAARPAWPRPEPPVTIVVQDARAPSWATVTPATTRIPWNNAPAAIRVPDLLCQVTVAKSAYVGKTPPGLGVRVTVGRDLPRVQRWHLGKTTKTATFLAPGVDLVAGERLRLSFTDEESRRGLGGGIVEMTGELPLTVKGPAVEARCTEAPAGALDVAAGELEKQALAVVGDLDAALKSQDAGVATLKRREARDLVTSLAMHAGWSSERVVTVRTALAAADPAERFSPSSR
jgi:hypothetical protein